MCVYLQWYPDTWKWFTHGGYYVDIGYIDWLRDEPNGVFVIQGNFDW